MTYSGSGRVTLVSLTNGQLLAQLSDNDAQIYALSEPGTITLQGEPSQIASWSKQENDLILQQQDGATTRFQSFFDADNGDSRLVFQSGSLSQPVQLKAVSGAVEGVTALEPVLHHPASVASTLSIHPVNTAEAADASAEKSGELLAVPHPTIDTPFGDGWLNREEKQENQTLSGTTGVTGSGQTVTVVIGGKPHEATVTDEGKWSLVLTPEAMQQGFGDGLHKIMVIALDADGHKVKIETSYTVDTASPTIAIDPLPDGGNINLNAITTELIITGTGTAGDIATIRLGDRVWQPTVTSAGKWSVTLEAADAQQLEPGDYTLTASVRDFAGNTASASLPVSFFSAPVQPTITIDPVAIDNIVDVTEISSGLNINGHTTGLQTGAAVEVRIGDAVFQGVVYENTWFVTLDADAVKAIADGYYTLTASAANDAGTATADRAIILYTHPGSSEPTLSFNELTAADEVTHDGVLYYKLSGTLTEGVLPAENVSLYGGELLNTYPLNVTGNTFTVEIPAAELTSSFGFYVRYQDLTGLTEQSHYTADIPDLPGEVGEPGATPHPTIDTPFDDGILNFAEKHQNETLTGTTGITGSGQTVRVIIGGVAHWATVTDEGSWSLVLTPADMKQGFGDGKHSIMVTAFDEAGHSATVNSGYSVDTVLPRVTIDTPFGNGVLTQAEKNENETLTGTTGVTGGGQSVRVVIGGVTHWATVTDEGNWSLALTPADMAKGFDEGRHTILITAFDAADNNATIKVGYLVDSALPTVTIDTLSDDNRIDLTAVASDIVISGTATAGDRLEVTFGAFSDPRWDLTLDSSGKWQVTLTQAELQGLAPGDYAIKATVTDSSGLSSTATLDVNFYDVNVTPTLTVNPVSTDDLVTSQDLSVPLELTGSVSGVAPATDVVVKIGDSVFYGTVDGAATWHATLDAEAVRAIADGKYTAEVSVDNGTQTASASRDLTFYTHAHSSDPTLTFNPLTADDIVTHDGVQYYELSGILTEGALPVTEINLYGGESLSYYPLKVAANGTDFTVEIPTSAYNSIEFHELAVLYNDITGTTQQNQRDVILPDAPSSVDDTAGLSASLVDVSAESAATEHGSSSTEENSASSATESHVAATAHSESSDGVAQTVGTEADDRFTLSTLNLLSNLNGGVGHDTLLLDGKHEALDFAALGLKVSSVETIDLGASGSNSLTLGQKDLLSLTGNGSEALTIKGADGSQVTLSTAEGGVWSDVGQRTVDGQPFELYHNTSASHEGALADVLIQHNLQVHTV